MRKIITSTGWFPIILFGIVFIPLAVALLIPSAVTAQCGSSASTCKNCHEVNAAYPVNASGDWHTAHAFGDFCEFCHAGNVQATDKDAAHVGMIYPLSDPQASCASCHAQDYPAKAQIYAAALGTTAGGGGATSSTNASTIGTSGTTQNTDASDPNAAVCKPIAAPGENNATGALIDFNRRYDIEVLGKTDTSRTGNTVLWVVGALLLAVSAAVVWKLEKLGDVWRKARAVPEDEDWRRLAYSGAYDVHGPVIPGKQSPVDKDGQQ
jgi:hypothetical protein